MGCRTAPQLPPPKGPPSSPHPRLSPAPTGPPTHPPTPRCPQRPPHHHLHRTAFIDHTRGSRTHRYMESLAPPHVLCPPPTSFRSPHPQPTCGGWDSPLGLWGGTRAHGSHAAAAAKSRPHSGGLMSPSQNNRGHAGAEAAGWGSPAWLGDSSLQAGDSKGTAAGTCHPGREAGQAQGWWGCHTALSHAGRAQAECKHASALWVTVA